MKTERWKLLKDDEPIPDYAVMSRGGRWIKLQVREEGMWMYSPSGHRYFDESEWQDVTWEEE